MPWKQEASARHPSADSACQKASVRTLANPASASTFPHLREHRNACMAVSIRTQGQNFVQWPIEQPLLSLLVVWSGLQDGAKVKLKDATNLSERYRKTSELLAVEEFCGPANLRFCRAVPDALTAGENFPITTVNP